MSVPTMSSSTPWTFGPHRMPWRVFLCLIGVLGLLPSHATAQPMAVVHDQLHRFVATPTVTARQSGPWSDGATWQNGVVPSHRARVAIPNGLTVTVDREIATAYDWVRVDGTLRFRPDINTQLIVETLVAMGRLEIGTAAAPIQPHVTARLIIQSPGTAISHQLDPLELTRGLIPMAPVSIHGAAKREISSLAVLPAAGATTLQLDVDPSGWRVDDEVLVAPTIYDQDEVVRVTAINGRTISISPALKFTRQNVPTPNPKGPPLPMPIKVHVGNLTRNVVIQTHQSQAGDAKLQGHVMLMGGGHQVFHAGFSDLGRTSTFVPVTDPILRSDGTRNPQLVPDCGMGTENPRGRYSLHFHNPFGMSAAILPSEVVGVVIRVQRNKGFKVGIQNHSSYVNVRRAVTHQLGGSHIMTEEGNERGVIEDSLMVQSYGSNASDIDFPRHICFQNHPDPVVKAIGASRRVDMAHKGQGIWHQGNEVPALRNVGAGLESAGYDNWAADPIGPGAEVITALLRGGDWWLRQSAMGPDYLAGKHQTLLQSTPPVLVAENQFYGIGGTRRYPFKAALVLEHDLHLDKWAPRPLNAYRRNLAWNVVHCVDARYSSWGLLEDMACIAGNIALGGYNSTTMRRMGVNTKTQDGRHWVYKNLRIDGFNDPLIPSDGSIFRAVSLEGHIIDLAPTRGGVRIEACADGIDNDGNGQIDESPCLPSLLAAWGAENGEGATLPPPASPINVRIVR